MEIKAYVTNLGLYNEGILCGEWVTFPITEDEQEALFERIRIDEEHEEYFMTDYESDIDLYETFGEYVSIEKLNELADELNSLNETDSKIVEALMSNCYDLEDAIAKKDDVVVYFGCTSMREVAEEYAKEVGLLDSIPEHLRYYFDFEAFGRDMSFEGEYIFYGGDCYEVMN